MSNEEMMHADAYEEAKMVAQDVRTYVRDRFMPGSLDSLNELEREVTAKVYAALVQDRVVRPARAC